MRKTYNRRSYAGKGNPNYNQALDKVCVICGNNFHSSLTFCSNECYLKNIKTGGKLGVGYNFKRKGKPGIWAGKHIPDSAKKKLSEFRSNKTYEELMGSEMAIVLKEKRRLQAKTNNNWIYAKQKHPSGPEIHLNTLLQVNFPNMWKFVGNGGVIINRMKPDFINIAGRRQVIEVFGDYWHKDEDQMLRVNALKESGYECLVIWEHELKDELILIRLLKEFMR